MEIDIQLYKDREITDVELDMLYMYLDLECQNMDEEEIIMWYHILKKIDKSYEE